MKQSKSIYTKRQLTIAARILRKYAHFLQTGYTKDTYKKLFADTTNLSVIAFLRAEDTTRDSYRGELQRLSQHYETFAENKIISTKQAKAMVEDLVGSNELVWMAWEFKREAVKTVFAGLK